MLLKQADRSATLSFCPTGPFLAAGSVAGAIDLSFSTSSVLEIFRLDFASTDHDLKLAGGAVQAPERFSRVCWGPPGGDSKAYPYGLIAGGLADGSVCVWNPARIIGHKAEQPTSPAAASSGQLLARLQKHQGPVKGLEFNNFSPNLLASGGADGELCIWDVGNPAQPSLYPAMKGGAAGPQPEITHLAWNRKVQHILGTCTAAGTVVVWDLKKQRPVISFKDPSGRKRCSALQWNPEVATQLMVASDDDQSPSLQLWDLRNSVSPIREFHGHAKGVLGMSWCPQDSSFLLSSGKDNRTLCWDVNAGEVYCEMPPAANWHFDVQWAPGQLAGVFATATFEGQVGISSLAACTAGGGESDGFSIGQAVPTAAKVKAPAWLQRPCGAAFGFGGKLVQFSNTKRQLPTGETATAGSITISQVMTEPEFVERSEAFEAAIRGGDREALSTFCQAREQQLEGSEEAETWAFLQTHFAADGRKFLLERLGFGNYLPVVEPVPTAADEEAAAAAAGEAAAAAGAAAAGMEQMRLEQQAAAAAAAEHLLHGDGADFFEQSPRDGAAFFDHIAQTPPRATPVSPKEAAAGPASPPPLPKEAPVIDGPAGEGEAEIQKMLFVGNYSDAVEACLEAKRHADAMVIASVAGGELWDKARKAYMTAHPRPFMRMLHSVLSGDWTAFINARHPSAWRETMAAILTSAPYEQFEGLLAALAGRLASAGMAHAATLCFICAGDVDSAVRQWGKAVVKNGQAPSVDSLEALMEKAVILGIGVNRQSASEALSDLIVRYAELLAANGRLGMALEYLQMIPGEPSGGVAVLKDRLYRSAAGSAQLPLTVAPPPFPFAAEDVSASAASYQQQTAAASAYGQQQQQQSSYGQQQSAYGQQQQPQQQQSAYQASYGGGYGQQQQPQNGYGAAQAAPSSYAAPDYGQQQQPQQPTYQSYGGEYGAAQQPQPVPPPPTAYQSVRQGGYGATASPTSSPMAAASMQQQQQQQPGVYQPAAAPAAAAPPTAMPAVYQPAAAPQAPSYAPVAGPPPTGPPPQVYQPAAAAPMAAAAPVAAPQVYQPAAAPAVYQQAPAGPSVGAAYQPTSRPPSMASGALPSPTFVPQQGPGGMPLGAGGGTARPGPTPTPITAPPPPPPGPPKDIPLDKADTSGVRAEYQPVVATIRGLFEIYQREVGAHPSKAREVHVNSCKLGVLFWKLNKGEVSTDVCDKLVQLCTALSTLDAANFENNFATANQLQNKLSVKHGSECSTWLLALKSFTKVHFAVAHRQMMGH